MIKEKNYWMGIIKLKFLMFFFIFISISAFLPIASLVSRSDLTAKAYDPDDLYFQEIEKATGELKANGGEELIWSRGSTTTTGDGGKRRRLRGLGSSPPRCAWKCGRCTPCKPVHVPVPPGTPVTAEYYPEAWRCKCGNKLYMP